MNFEINLISLTKPFFLHDQNVNTKICIENEKSFKDEISRIFHQS